MVSKEYLIAKIKEECKGGWGGISDFKEAENMEKFLRRMIKNYSAILGYSEGDIPTFHPKRCKKGDSCHAPSPALHPTKGSCQWKTGSLNRARLPYGLSLAICKAVEAAIQEE